MKTLGWLIGIRGRSEGGQSRQSGGLPTVLVNLIQRKQMLVSACTTT
jgi:hypothetical protein